MDAYIIRDADGDVIAQYVRNNKPKKPERYDGAWNVENVPLSDLNTEEVNWWVDPE